MGHSMNNIKKPDTIFLEKKINTVNEKEHEKFLN